MRNPPRTATVLAIALAVLVNLAVGSPSAWGQQQQAQESLVDEADLAAAVDRQLQTDEARRQQLRRLLERPQIRDIAERWGLDLRRAEDAVDTLDGDELAEASAHAETLESALSGGNQVITIGLVPLLLIIIIIILLA